MEYVQMKTPQGDLETVDEFKTYKEARLMLKEYRLSDTYNEYYLSQRACKGWELMNDEMYIKKIEELEAEGLTTSDAQAVLEVK